MAIYTSEESTRARTYRWPVIEFLLLFAAYQAL